MKKISVFYSNCFGRYALLVVLMMVSAVTYAQKIAVTGTVTDPSNEPIIGASVIVQGGKGGTPTDLDGRFNITATKGSTIVVSYIGCKSETVRITGSEVKVVLKEDSKALDEVIVVGYGVQKKSVVTASIAKVSAEELDKVNPVRLDDALKGLAAGVNVTSVSGQPGAG